MQYDLPPGFPTADKFQPSQITTWADGWEYHRSPGSGGANYGDDHIPPNDPVVVGVEYNVQSDTGAGGFDYHVVTKSLGVVVVPIGFHAGARLEPGGPFGSGATFKGDVTLKLVSLQVWLPVALSSR